MTSFMERLGFGTGNNTPQGQAPNATVPVMLQGDTLPATQQLPVTQPQVTTTQQQTPPEDIFKDLWSNDPKLEAPQGINFNIAPDKLQELAGKVDYAALVPVDIRQRIMAGGEDAINAMLEAQNLTSRAVYANSIQGTTKLVEMAAKDAEERITASLESKFKLMSLKDHFAVTNPALQDPMLKPIVDSCQAQVVKKFPNASSTEIAQMTEQYFNQVAGKLAPGMNKPAPVLDASGRPAQADFDWAAYLNS